MKVGFLINNRLGIPSLQVLLENKIPISILIPDQSSEDVDHIKHICSAYGQTPTLIEKRLAKKQLDQWVSREKPSLILVMTFPYIIPSNLLKKPGTAWFNFHFAPLPQYRGAEPIFWMLKNQESHGGITVHQLTDKLDAGPIALSQEVAIDASDTHGLHISKLSEACIPLTIDLLNKWQQLQGQIPLTPQLPELSKTYPKASLKDTLIDWENMSSAEITALIRACNPWNKGAITFLNSVPLRICEVELVTDLVENSGKPGSILLHGKSLIVKCNDDQQLILNIIYINEGYFSGLKFNSIFNANGSFFNTN